MNEVELFIFLYWPILIPLKLLFLFCIGCFIYDAWRDGQRYK